MNDDRLLRERIVQLERERDEWKAGRDRLFDLYHAADERARRAELERDMWQERCMDARANDGAMDKIERERDEAKADAEAARKECTALTLHVWNLDTKMSAHLDAAEQDAARLAAALRKAHDQLEHYVVCRGEGRGQTGCEATDALAAHEERVKR